MSRLLFSVVPLAASLFVTTPVWAGRAIPFYVTDAGGSGADAKILCRGPWARKSACVPTTGLTDGNFYEAWDNIFSAYGQWTCRYASGFKGTPKPGIPVCGNAERESTVEFCLGEDDPKVSLLAQGGKLTVNLPADCNSAFQTGTLASASAAASAAAATKVAASGSDVDTYEFPARAGEKLVVRLDRDGAAGSDGSLVALRVLDAGGGEIARRRGKIPFELEVTAPSAGIQIAVESVGAKGDQAFEGGYTVEVTPRSGRLDNRLTKPAVDVEY